MIEVFVIGRVISPPWRYVFCLHERVRRHVPNNDRFRFERILDDLGDCLPFDGPTWAKRTVATYNALKHANRALPDEADVMNSWAESVMLVRAWVALELDIAMDVVKSRLADDRQRRHYVKAE